jgi:hypothetical protein
MANPTASQFKTRFPEFTDIDDDRIEFFIQDAVLECSEQAYGALYPKVVCLLAAHFLSISNRFALSATGMALSGGSLTSRTVGDVTVSFATRAAATSDEEYYRQSPYGAEFYRLQISAGMGMLVVS